MPSEKQKTHERQAQPPAKKQRMKGPARNPIMDQFFRQVLSGRQVPESLIPSDASQREENGKRSAGEKLERLFALGRVLNLQSGVGVGLPAGVAKADVVAELDRRLTNHLGAMYDQLDHYEEQALDQRDGTLTITSRLGSNVTNMDFMDMFLKAAANPRVSKEMLQERVRKYQDDNTITPAPAPTKHSSRLARFHPGFDASAALGTKAAENIHQARCDVLTDLCCKVHRTAASEDGSVIAIAGGAGWKDRAPALVAAKIRGSADEDEESNRDLDYKQ